MGRLAEKVAIITGGAGGIGMAAGKRFAAEGAQVLLVDLNEQALIDACAEIGGNHVSYLVGDVTRAADNARMVETATERYGGVDIFLANAGIEGDVASILDYDEARFDQVMSVNVKGPFLGPSSGGSRHAAARRRQYDYHVEHYRRAWYPAFGTLCDQ